MKNEQKLPFLPGMVFSDPSKQNFQKSQNFKLYSNQMVESSKLLKNNQPLNIPINLNDNLQDENILNNIQNQIQNSKENNNLSKAIQKIKELKVLRFYSQFTQKVTQSSQETECHRNAIILYHLEDDTMVIIEPQELNSGMMQGKYLNRQRVYKNTGEPITFLDLNVQQDININGQIFTLQDCDECTRLWYIALDNQQPQKISKRKNQYFEKIEKSKQKRQDASIKEHKHYCEVSLGGGNQNEGLKKYLQYGKNALSFDALWDDKSYGGELNKYKILYYLSDDTVEVKEMHELNNGKSPFPLLLKRSKLPKQNFITHCPGMLKPQESFYQIQDFILGKTVKVYNREFLLVNCDNFTKQFFNKELGIQQQVIEEWNQESQFQRKKQNLPPHNGFGSEIDTVQNCLYLIPKPPKVDMAKKFIYNRVTLRFECRKISKQIDENDKRFLLSYFCGDDQLMIYLLNERNSGYDGGKYLERQKYKNEDTKQYFKVQDLYIGNILSVNKQKFQLLSADEYTLNFMYQKPELFPQQNPQKVFNDIKSILNQFSNFQQFEEYFLTHSHKEMMDLVSLNDIINLFNQMNLKFDYLQCFTLFYLCDKENDQQLCHLGEIIGILKQKIFNDNQF